MNRSVFTLLSLLLLLPATGCLFLPGRAGLERLQDERGSPYAAVTFRKEPGEGERSLAELRDTLTYWAGTGSHGVPRWEGILVPDSPDLYETLLERIESGGDAFTLVSYRYDAKGFDDITLVDYFDGSGQLVGSDHLAFPAPLESPSREGRAFLGYESMAWWEYPQMVLDVPVYLAVGLKELAGEIVKSPLSFFEVGWTGVFSEGRSPVSPVCFERAGGAFVGDWKDGFTSLSWRFRVRRRHTPLDLAADLLGSLPLVGPVFDHKSPPPGAEPLPPASLIVLSQGIIAGGENEQYMASWKRAVEEARGDTPVAVAPYYHGGTFDVIWSLLNLSHGSGHDLASRVIFHEGIRPGEAVEIAGFSGGAQRGLAATHALRKAGVGVRRLVGVAGPVAGFSCAVEGSLLLTEQTFDDPVVFTARLTDVLYPFHPNLATVTVPGAGGHYLPWLPHPSTRSPRSGYAEAILKALDARGRAQLPLRRTRGERGALTADGLRSRHRSSGGYSRKSAARP